MSEPNGKGVSPSPSSTSLALIVLTLALLTLFVWFLNPRQPHYRPAPLRPPSPECRKPGREFVPTNLTALSDPGLDALPNEERNEAIFRLNTVPCSCGCQLSVAFCRKSNSGCELSNQMFKQITSEAGEKVGRAPKKN